MVRPFRLVSDFQPRGDQPQAIEKLTTALQSGAAAQNLLGVTGSGKTFTMAHVIARLQRPSLVIAPNKTLAAQLYREFKEFFPENAVEYFVSYYDYYQPEAYVPSQDLYIEKDSSINEEIDKMRHAATRSLFERNDVIIVASVSCIYGLGSPEAYHGLLVLVEQGTMWERNALLLELTKIQYSRNDYDFHRGTFRVRGDVVEVFPAHEEDRAIRIEFFGDEIEAIHEIDPLRGQVLASLDKIAIYPASHFVTWEDRMKSAVLNIRVELEDRLRYLTEHNFLVEAQRLQQRTHYDLEMMQEIGFCKGIENYSRHITGRKPGQPPPTLLDYFPKNYLTILDESHITVPQIQGMYNGDRARKQNLVDYGFRLPSALDNRPLRFEEFNNMTAQVVYVSATPGEYELQETGGDVVEQVIRPTGLMDPTVDIRPVTHQVDDLIGEIRQRMAQGERVLVTTLTKRMSEDLTQYMTEVGLKVRYLHSDIDTLERVAILKDLRRGKFDVLVGSHPSSVPLTKTLPSLPQFSWSRKSHRTQRPQVHAVAALHPPSLRSPLLLFRHHPHFFQSLSDRDLRNFLHRGPGGLLRLLRKKTHRCWPSSCWKISSPPHGPEPASSTVLFSRKNRLPKTEGIKHQL